MLQGVLGFAPMATSPFARFAMSVDVLGFGAICSGSPCLRGLGRHCPIRLRDEVSPDDDPSLTGEV